MAPLVSTALGFLILEGVGFNGYIFVNTFDPPPLNHCLGMGLPLGGNFDALRGIRVIGRGGRGIKAN